MRAWHPGCTHARMSNEQLARRVFEAYPAGDRATLEEILAPEFRFTSPYDDAIDRDEYFRRCWPNHAMQRSVHFHHVIAAGDTVVVAYELVMVDGRHVNNAEVLTFAHGKLVSVFVHFGAERDASGAFVPMKH